MKDLTVTRPFSEEDYNELLQHAVAVLPWSHNLLLMSYDLSPEYIVFYAKGWLRDMLNLALKSEYPLNMR